MLDQLRQELKKFQDPQKAVSFSRFFKTKEGEYGYGDVFLGVTVPQSRLVAAKFPNLLLLDVQKLLMSKIHEERLIGLFILVHQFKKGSDIVRENLYNFYLENTKHVNNWDLVDSSAYKIVGEYLRNKKDRSILEKFAKSQSMWERRIAIIATFQFILKEKSQKDTFKIAEILIPDKNDLIQKAVGWMLREVGKRVDEKAVYEFLDKNYKNMGRTALRYSIERFPEKIRLQYLKGEK